MENNSKETAQKDFQIIFDKLEEAKKEHKDLFVLNSESESSLSDSIREIKKIVDSYSAPNTFTLFTRA